MTSLFDNIRIPPRHDHGKPRAEAAEHARKAARRLSRGKKAGDRTDSRWLMESLDDRSAILPPYNAAYVVEGRTKFPTTRRDPDNERVLKSARNNAKIGARILTGKWQDLPVFTLTLEERATCPPLCPMWRGCYGNHMHLAHRIAHGPALEAKVPPFLYEPPQRRLRGVGEILEALPLPGDLRAGPMHRMPALQWKTWVRLAFVEAGSDWRSLNKLNVVEGVLTDFGIVPVEYWQHGVLGVRNWDEPSGVVTARSGPTNGNYAVADPRPIKELHGGTYGVQRMEDSSGVVTSQRSPGQGTFSVADPRIDGHEKSVQMGVRRWTDTGATVTSKMFVGGGPHSVADPRLEGKRFNNIFRIVPWAQPSPSVAGPGGPAGGIAVADPRPVGLNANREDYKTGGHYGVVPWDEHTRAVPGFAKYDRGPWAVADGRDQSSIPVSLTDELKSTISLPAGTDRLVCIIRALDGTWHRPFTTLELAALQSLVDAGEMFELDGKSDSRWREGIGNAVPPDAAEAIGSVMATTLLLAMSGETFVLSNEPIWVQPLMIALAVDHSPNAGSLD